jgi:hypothetical protein
VENPLPVNLIVPPASAGLQTISCMKSDVATLSWIDIFCGQLLQSQAQLGLVTLDMRPTFPMS